ncbi:MAG TPA: class I tRNA ligase family protein, partial [Nitrospirota bacterium]
RLSEERIEGYRNFCNKIWNAARFTHMNLTGFEATELVADDLVYLPDKWIVHRLNQASKEIDRYLTSYEFDKAANEAYHFFWHEFCDWYLELIKPVLYLENIKDKKHTLNTLVNVFDASMRLLHPFMPFITEEIWQSLPKSGRPDSIMVAEFAGKDGYSFPEIGTSFASEAGNMDSLIATIDEIRKIRGELGVKPSLEITANIKPLSAGVECFMNANADLIKRLARVGTIEVSMGLDAPKQAAKAVTPDCEIYVPLEGIVDIDAEVARLKKEIEKTDKEVKPHEGKLANEGFVAKAPPEVLEKTRGIIAELNQKKEKLSESLARLEGMK